MVTFFIYFIIVIIIVFGNPTCVLSYGRTNSVVFLCSRVYFSRYSVSLTTMRSNCILLLHLFNMSGYPNVDFVVWRGAACCKTRIRAPRGATATTSCQGAWSPMLVRTSLYGRSPLRMWWHLKNQKQATVRSSARRLQMCIASQFLRLPLCSEYDDFILRQINVSAHPWD